MIVDRSGRTVARRTAAGVEVWSLTRILGVPGQPGPVELVPPRGHFVVAVELEGRHRFVTSDGEMLWVCGEHPLGAPTSLAVVAREAGARDMARIELELAECARCPMGPLQAAAFYPRLHTTRSRASAEPDAPWPGLVFGVGHERIVAVQLEFRSYRSINVSPYRGSADDEHRVREARIHAWSMGPGQTVHAIIRAADGGTWVGEPRALEEAFDAAYELLAPIEVPQTVTAAALCSTTAATLIYAVASEEELVIGHATLTTRSAGSGASAASQRFDLRGPERLIGVTGRAEALVVVGGRIEAWTVEGGRALVDAGAPIVEAASGREAVVFRVAGGESMRAVFL